MTKLRFLATSSDPRPDHAGTVYGAGHETDFDESDYEFVKQLRLEGRAEILDDTLDATIMPPPAEAPAA